MVHLFFSSCVLFGWATKKKNFNFSRWGTCWWCTAFHWRFAIECEISECDRVSAKICFDFDRRRRFAQTPMNQFRELKMKQLILGGVKCSRLRIGMTEKLIAWCHVRHPKFTVLNTHEERERASERMWSGRLIYFCTLRLPQFSFHFTDNIFSLFFLSRSYALQESACQIDLNKLTALTHGTNAFFDSSQTHCSEMSKQNIINTLNNVRVKTLFTW